MYISLSSLGIIAAVAAWYVSYLDWKKNNKPSEVRP